MPNEDYDSSINSEPGMDSDRDFESDDFGVESNDDYGPENDPDLESIDPTHASFATREIEGRRCIYCSSGENIKKLDIHPTQIINFLTTIKNYAGKWIWNLL